ncbi:MAG: DUF2975 domain-containing protein [Hyphomonadaceae bacterium]|jgi:hypothetical protein|nr:DUF2975 domain-containing protein [Hyphomonadaceae bacterium]
MSRAELLKSRSRRLANLSVVACVVLAAFLLLETFGALTVASLHGEPVAPQLFWSGAVSAAPACFYLWGLWQVRSALAAIGVGEMFAPVAASAIERVGWALMIGGIVSVAVVPTLRRIVGDDPGYVLAFDVAGVVLSVVGLVLVLFADLFRRAAKLQAEMREII